MKSQKLTLVFVSISLLFSSYCFGQVNSEEADFMSIKKTFSDGFYSLAEENIEEFFNKYPDTYHIYEARLLLGRCFYYQNNLKKALYEFDIILNTSSASMFHDAALYWLGDVYYRTNDFKNSFEYYQKVIDEYPVSKYVPYALYSKAWSYYKLGFLEDSISAFTEVVSRYPLEKIAADSLFKIGENEYLLSDFEKTRNTLNNLINKYPLSERIAESYYLLGDIDLRREKHVDAISELKRALSISPEAKWASLATFRIAQAYFIAQDFDQSIKYFESGIKGQINALVASSSYLGLVYNYEKKGMMNEAMKICDTINSKFPKIYATGESYYMKAKILCDSNRLSEAEEICIAALDKALPAASNGKLHYELGWIYLKENKSKDALKEFRIAGKYLEDDLFASSALCKIGDIYLENGEYDNATESFDSSLKDYPDSPYADYAQYRLGDIFLSTKKYDQAILAYQSLLVNFPGTELKAKAILRLGIAYFKKNLFAEALTEFNRIAKLFPQSIDNVIYRFYLANSLYNVGRYDEALEIFKALSKNTTEADIVMRSQYQIGWCYYNMGRDMDAVDSFEFFIKKNADSVFKQNALDQSAFILKKAAQNFEKWKMPNDAVRMYKRLETLKGE